jgi:hypothetical protein
LPVVREPDLRTLPGADPMTRNESSLDLARHYYQALAVIATGLRDEITGLTEMPRRATRRHMIQVAQQAIATVPVPTEASEEVERLRAGISWVRGMCTDGEPLEAIDAKLGEILNG